MHCSKMNRSLRTKPSLTTSLPLSAAPINFRSLPLLAYENANHCPPSISGEFLSASTSQKVNSFPKNSVAEPDALRGRFSSRTARPKAWSACVLLLGLIAATEAPADDTAEKLKQHLDRLATKNGFSGAVIVMKDGKPLLREAYGKANYELDVPNTVDTRFRLGSITKQFTAMAVMVLAERERLSIDDPVSEHLDNSPAAWENVTIRHLLTHTSGIPSYTSFPQMMTRTVRAAAKLDDVIASFKDKSLDFPPGEKFTYSNSGYILLGKIIESASGQSYETFLRDNIFQPLEMNDSGYDHNSSILPRRAAGYTRTLIFLENAPYIDMTWPHAAGALYSTVEDLAKWDTALSAGQAFRPFAAR